jgi:hypothetical protein
MKAAPQTGPTAAWWLGLFGVVPFAACALQVASGWPLGGRMTGPALFLLLNYGAVILSFMGGAQWGLAVASSSSGTEAWRRYGVSVLPALLGWLGLWIGARSGLLLMTAGFAMLLTYDLWTVAQGEAPAWYGRLRIVLTAAVVGSLLLAATFGPF